MTESPSMKAPELHEIKPKITVVGVGGAGGNAVNNMIRYNLQGVDFVTCNTDAQSLAHSLAEKKIQIGELVTQGLGAGSRPEVGRASAEESYDAIHEAIRGSNMVFVTAGMGGGTGTGAAPIVAQAAREQGILTVAVVTKPFHFEGKHRMRTADTGIEELEHFVDTLIIIPNQNLFRVATEKTTFAEAFKMADDVLYSGVRGVTDLMIMPGLINLDFADIRAVMMEMGKAMMGTGEAEGAGRAISAAEAAISNPLLDDVSMKGAQGVLINITGGLDMTLFEVDEAANRIREEVDPDANIIFGSTFDEGMNGKMRVSVVATGIESAQAKAKMRIVETEKPGVMASKETEGVKVTSRGIFRRQKEMPEDEEEMDVLTVNFGGKEADAESSARQEHPQEPSFSLNAESDAAEYDHREEQFESEGYEEEVSSKKVGFFGRMARTLGLKKEEEEVSFEEGHHESEMTFVADPSPRVKAANEEDTLEIPAYLRRKVGK